MQSTTAADIRLLRGNRAAAWRYHVVSLLLSLAINACINDYLSGAAVLETETGIRRGGQENRCEELTNRMCRPLLQYERTMLPNLLGHQTQEEASLELHQYIPLVTINCSRHLAPFLCTLFAPPCTEVDVGIIPPCRSFCEAARDGCVQLLNQFGFEWPESFSCSHFPESGLCLKESVTEDESPELQSPMSTRREREETIPSRLDLSQTPDPQNGRCEAVTVPLCRGRGYEETITPNFLGHQTQEEASLELHQYIPLVTINCSRHLAPFLCTLYAPSCTEVDVGIIPPCRSFCEAARIGCVQLLNQFGFEWPESFSCSHFPESGLCLKETI